MKTLMSDSAFSLVDTIFLELNILGKVCVSISNSDSPLWLRRAANSVIYWCSRSNQLPKEFIREIQFAGFAAMHLRAATSCFR